MNNKSYWLQLAKFRADMINYICLVYVQTNFESILLLTLHLSSIAWTA